MHSEEKMEQKQLANDVCRTSDDSGPATRERQTE